MSSLDAIWTWGCLGGVRWRGAGRRGALWGGGGVAGGRVGYGGVGLGWCEEVVCDAVRLGGVQCSGVG